MEENVIKRGEIVCDLCCRPPGHTAILTSRQWTSTEESKADEICQSHAVAYGHGLDLGMVVWKIEKCLLVAR